MEETVVAKWDYIAAEGIKIKVSFVEKQNIKSFF